VISPVLDGLQSINDEFLQARAVKAIIFFGDHATDKANQSSRSYSQAYPETGSVVALDMAPPSYTIRMLRERDVIRDYLNEVVNFLGRQVSQSLAMIGTSCKKPPSIEQSLGDLICAHSHRFELVRAGTSTVVSRQAQAVFSMGINQ
jgi:hypothetical protein